MPSSTLAIAGRIVARSEGGTLETEYALFEPHEIELRSHNEPGTVREDGYRTTVALAKERLELDGVTGELAEMLTESMRPLLVTAYARGALVRRIGPSLDAALVFQSRVYDARNKIYEGLWLDLAALAKDCGIERASTAFQALYLAATMRELPDDASIYLSTSEYAKARRPGERTHRRIVLHQTARLVDALHALATKGPPLSPRDVSPNRADLLEGIRARIALASPQTREPLLKLEKELATREMPPRGPLADAELWGLETQLSAGDASGVVERVDAIEKTRGRQPGTAYLRARAALVLGKEDPRAVAERVSALAMAMSMSAFAELELLAAEAWARAGDTKRALPYARDILGNTHVHEELRGKAEQIVASAEGRRGSLVPSASASSVPAEAPAAPREESAAPIQPAPIVSLSEEPLAREPLASARPPAPAFLTPAEVDHISQSALRAQSRPPKPTLSAAQRISALPPPAPDPYAPRASSHPPPPPQTTRSSAPPKPPSVPPDEARARSSPSMPPLGSVHPPPPRSLAPSSPVARFEEASSAAAFDPRREPSEAPAERAPPSVPPTARSNESEPPESEAMPLPYMKGASQPPFRTEAPPADLSGERLIPESYGPIELASKLSLPPGLHGEVVQIESDELPASIVEARIHFTQLSRELGRQYKDEYGIELRTDVRSIEIMQRHLKERFPTGEVLTKEEAMDVRRHGAFLSEILARTLGAEWVDIALSEIGYWSMVVPPGTLVWPFGRVLRLVAMQHKERDLVSYYLELQARQRRR